MNKKPKIALISPPNHFSSDPPAPSLSLAVLSGLLLKEGVEHFCLDGNFFDAGVHCLDDEEGFISAIFNELISGEPDIIGISTWGVTLPFTILLIRMIKNTEAAIPIVIGGIKSRREAVELIKELQVDGISPDAIVLGECDNYYTALMLGIYYKSIKKSAGLPESISGYAEKIGNTAVFRFPQQNSSLWGRANYNNFKGSVGRKFFFEGSRGCTHSCVFCSARSGTYRRKKADLLVEEVGELKKEHAPLFLNFADNIFPLSGSWIRNYCNTCIEENIDIEWAALARNERPDSEILSLMKKSGCVNLFIGVESPNPGTLKYIKKAHDTEQYLNDLWSNLESILNSGISIIASTIIGFPDETAEDMKNTVKFVKDCRRMGIKAYSGPLVLYPGSFLWSEHEAGRINLFRPAEGRLRRNHPGFGASAFADNPVFASNYYLPANRTMSNRKFENCLLNCLEELEA